MGKFYFACQNQGVIQWNPITNTDTGFLPGDPLPFNPNAFRSRSHPLFGFGKTSVRYVDKYGDSAIVATTGRRVMLYTPAAAAWDSSITTTLVKAPGHFVSFVYAFTNNTLQPPLLYAFIACDTVTIHGRPTIRPTIQRCSDTCGR